MSTVYCSISFFSFWCCALGVFYKGERRRVSRFLCGRMVSYIFEHQKSKSFWALKWALDPLPHIVGHFAHVTLLHAIGICLWKLFLPHPSRAGSTTGSNTNSGKITSENLLRFRNQHHEFTTKTKLLVVSAISCDTLMANQHFMVVCVYTIILFVHQRLSCEGSFYKSNAQWPFWRALAQIALSQLHSIDEMCYFRKLHLSCNHQMCYYQ